MVVVVAPPTTVVVVVLVLGVVLEVLVVLVLVVVTSQSTSVLHVVSGARSPCFTSQALQHRSYALLGGSVVVVTAGVVVELVEGVPGSVVVVVLVLVVLLVLVLVLVVVTMVHCSSSLAHCALRHAEWQIARASALSSHRSAHSA